MHIKTSQKHLVGLCNNKLNFLSFSFVVVFPQIYLFIITNTNIPKSWAKNPNPVGQLLACVEWNLVWLGWKWENSDLYPGGGKGSKAWWSLPVLTWQHQTAIWQPSALQGTLLQELCAFYLEFLFHLFSFAFPHFQDRETQRHSAGFDTVKSSLFFPPHWHSQRKVLLLRKSTPPAAHEQRARNANPWIWYLTTGLMELIAGFASHAEKKGAKPSEKPIC